ncbi:MAG TPA: ATP-dependent DNA helicase [Propionibacteriaceae bacterium]|nr:ATP-dependent DNA helicase [Propionibacteriaceae bacterium]
MYRLTRGPMTLPPPPMLDASQRAVVDHPGGPLLVLAGPGTGKTTTLVECVVDRIEHRGVPPDSILVLTFSRKAAADLRARIAARLGRTTVTPMAMTFHAFCYALVRRFGNEADLESNSHESNGFDAPLRLLTGPEQEFRVREVLRGSLETQRPQWPESLARAFPTRAFAGEVRAVLARARQLGMDPDDVMTAGHNTDRAEWVSLGAFFDEYLDVLDAEGVLDYAELVHRSRILLSRPEIATTLRSEIDCVFVDEYQDTDPSQVRLLQVVAGGGRDVVAVGDPDQSIYAFRGAEARGILDFPELFRTRRGAPAAVLALNRTHRFGSALLAASRSVASRLGMPRSLPAEVFAAFRHPIAEPERAKGKVEVFTCSSAGAEAEHIAEILRSSYLRDNLAWTDMAVLVRSGRTTIPGLTRALLAAGVPVEVAGDEIPLAADPAARPLLLALQVAARGCAPTADEAQLLLTSPLGGMDSMSTRRLGRALREAERAELAGMALPRSSVELTSLALRDRDLLEDCPPSPEVDAARALAELLRRCERAIHAGSTAEEALWLLWSQTTWPERLRQQAGAAGEAGRRANRDLDAICALFEIAARSEEVSGLRGVTGFLAEVEGQQIPADPLREGELRGSGVRVLTAHRAKGLEWDLVVVAGVQEGRWPDVRRRGSLLEPDQLGRHEVLAPVPTATRIAEERRLFYVACTRARSRLVVTAVAGTEGEADQPSRFLAELGVPMRELPGRPRRPLSLSALVAELRSTSVDPEVSPRLREEAAVRLARLADATDNDGRPLVPSARPEHWWGMRSLSRADQPLLGPEQPVHLSGSQLASVLACPRNWFLARKAQGEPVRTAAASFGSVVHVLAEYGAHNKADPEELATHLDSVWSQLAFDAHWLSAVERVEAESALERFVMWQQARSHLTLLGTEVEFSCHIDVGTDRVHLTGSADRVERDTDGRIRIVDFKTSKAAPTAADVALHDQLGVYQLAVQQGAFVAVAGEGARPAGAELVYLRLPDGDSGYPKTFQQASLDDVPFPVEPLDGAGSDSSAGQPTWVHRRLAEAANIIRREHHDARIGPACRYCPVRTSCPAQPTGQQVVR